MLQDGWKGYVQATWIATALLAGLLAVGEPRVGSDDSLAILNWTSAMLTTATAVWIAPLALLEGIKRWRAHRRAGERLRLRHHADIGHATADPALHWATRGVVPLRRSPTQQREGRDRAA